MKSSVIRILVFGIIVGLFSCKKRPKESLQSEITGDWTFTGIRLQTIHTVSYSDGKDNLKTVSISDVQSSDNKGEMQITGNALVSKELTYAMKTTVKAYVYENNRLRDSVLSPFSFNLKPISAVVQYKRIGADSIYFSPCFMGMKGKPGEPACVAGARIEILDDKLIVTSVVEEKTAQTKKGLKQSIVNKATATLTFEKRSNDNPLRTL